MRILMLTILFLSALSSVEARANPYAIPRRDMPDLEYAADPQLYQVLERAYLQIFQSEAGQSILASFEDCRESYFHKHFELKGLTAQKARQLCENAKRIVPQKQDESLSLEEKQYREHHRRMMSQRVHAQPRQHFLKIVSYNEDISSYTYLGNQTIVRLPVKLVYSEDLLAALLLHEMTIYFDRKNPTNVIGILKDHRIAVDQLNVDLLTLWPAWNNPFLSEALSVLRSYRQEMLFFSELSQESRILLEHNWFARLEQVRDQKSCGVLVVDYISEILMKDDAYLNYRWTASRDFSTKDKGPRPLTSREKIIERTQKDLELFLKTRIQSEQINTSLCEFSLIPEYGSDGITLNHGPRPPIKPGSKASMEKWEPKTQLDLQKDLRTKWDFYRELKGSKNIKLESVEEIQNKLKGVQNGK
ncbi:hypothetical protein QJS83_16930 [Bdellovibrio sp. 22V]|uniref:hypothetical protein n=1 Tax=Bdellovibrio sp. 22V TaxID=3044166 RepID=UPI002543BA15|nr:hypothetical protein [Bdellovibrio sp. 22V]WII72149.1 hypothetical protein QJS83_16930 [Bdellovibrio sp. 22V]